MSTRNIRGGVKSGMPPPLAPKPLEREPLHGFGWDNSAYGREGLAAGMSTRRRHLGR
jgi:hypothetical protein